jgi:glutamyl-tRNA reductase
MTLYAVVADASTVDADERTRLTGVVDRLAGDGLIPLVTCHRVEAYSLAEIDVPGMRPLRGITAVRRLLNVATGLESAVIGEDEVLHQVRQALQIARARGTVDGRLARLFEVATAAGRAARAGRADAGAGLAALAVDWLASRASIRGESVIVAGAGRMGAELGRQVRAAGAYVTVASRDRGRAERLAHKLGGNAATLPEAAEHAGQAAAVAIALAGPWLELRGPLPPVADISAPSAVPTDVRAELNGAVLTIDDLFRRDAAPPVGYIQGARAIVEARAFEYQRWLDSRPA